MGWHDITVVWRRTIVLLGAEVTRFLIGLPFASGMQVGVGVFVMTRLLVLLLVAFALAGMGAVPALGNDDSAVPNQAADADPVEALQIETEPAFLTLLNFDDSSHRVRLEMLSAGELALTSEFHQVGAVDALILLHDLATDPVTFRTSCTGCATATFGLAADQRLLVFIDDAGSDLTVRSDLRVVNEGGSTLKGRCAPVRISVGADALAL